MTLYDRECLLRTPAISRWSERPTAARRLLFNALTGSRQKVANYPGVTVERKSGLFHTPAGHQVNLIDLPGTYSLRGRSPDEEITRDFVLGRLAAEMPPDLLLCVADSTNLRLAIRLVLELKRIGRPLLLVLNMFDIANRRGIDIDLARLSEELGVPVRQSIAVRSGGIADLLRRTRRSRGWQPAAQRRKPLEPPRVANCAPPSARPTASSPPPSACRHDPIR